MNKSIALTTLLIATWGVAGCSRSGNQDEAGKKAPVEPEEADNLETPPPRPNERSIVGKWMGKNDDGQDITLTFTAQGTVKIAVDDDAGEGTYQVDFSKKPPHLDIDWGSRGKVNSILQLLDEGRLRLEQSDPGDTRPQSFTDAAVLLTRVR